MRPSSEWARGDVCAQLWIMVMVAQALRAYLTFCLFTAPSLAVAAMRQACFIVVFQVTPGLTRPG